MNKILYIVSLSVMIAFIFAPIYTYEEEEKVEVNIEEDIATEVEISEREQEMYDEIVRVSYIEDKKEWFVEYKKLYEKYPEYLAKQEEIYDVFNENELEKLFRIVEAEATHGTFQDKVNVAVTIFNRINHVGFGSTIDKIITPDQFSPLQDGRYYKVVVTKETVLACEYAYVFGIIEHDALFFDRTNGNSWAHRNLEEVKVNGDNAHRFYK
mgnify:CR=1 FL=1